MLGINLGVIENQVVYTGTQTETCVEEKGPNNNIELLCGNLNAEV